MTDIIYILCFAAVCVYLAVLIHSYRVARKPRRPSLAQRVAPYRGGYLPRTAGVSTEDALVDRWRELKKAVPADVMPLATRLEREHIVTDAMLKLHERVHPFQVEDEQRMADVVDLHQHSVKVG